MRVVLNSGKWCCRCCDSIWRKSLTSERTGLLLSSSKNSYWEGIWLNPLHFAKNTTFLLFISKKEYKESRKMQLLLMNKVCKTCSRLDYWSVSFWGSEETLPKSLPPKSLPTVLSFTSSEWLQMPVKGMPANSRGGTWTSRSRRSIFLPQSLQVKRQRTTSPERPVKTMETTPQHKLVLPAVSSPKSTT